MKTNRLDPKTASTVTGVFASSALRSRRRAALAGALLVAAGFGCSRRAGDPDPFPTPWNAQDHAVGRCVNLCQEDFGPRPITQEECDREEAGLEFFPLPVWDFEPNPEPVATMAYAYQDGSTEFLSTATPTCSVEEHAAGGEEVVCQAGYEPNAAPVARCGSTYAWHIRGGPFREWGGGVGRRLDGMAQDAAAAMGGSCTIPPPETPAPNTPAVCPEYDAKIADAPGVPYREPASRIMEGRTSMNAAAYYGMLVDLREWEGISFWARRGPDSQPGVRIVLGDRNTDDDASFLETNGGVTPRCRRNKECDCRNHRPCTFWPGEGTGRGGWYCADPALDESPRAQWHPWNHELPRCGPTQCDYRYPAYPNANPSGLDVPFFTPTSPLYALDSNIGCYSHTYKNDTTRDECYDRENGPLPPESTEKCGDPWLAPVRLNPDWTFYMVPFSELRQEGYGKEFGAIDLAAVSMVRFTWTVGWVDYWIDDVRFYRRRN